MRRKINSRRDEFEWCHRLGVAQSTSLENRREVGGIGFNRPVMVVVIIHFEEKTGPNVARGWHQWLISVSLLDGHGIENIVVKVNQ